MPVEMKMKMEMKMMKSRRIDWHEVQDLEERSKQMGMDVIGPWSFQVRNQERMDSKHCPIQWKTHAEKMVDDHPIPSQ